MDIIYGLHVSGDVVSLCLLLELINSVENIPSREGGSPSAGNKFPEFLELET
jgi:hypothetical protein